MWSDDLAMTVWAIATVALLVLGGIGWVWGKLRGR